MSNDKTNIKTIKFFMVVEKERLQIEQPSLS